MWGCVWSFGIVIWVGFEIGSNNEWDVVGIDVGFLWGVWVVGVMYCVGVVEGDEVV